MAWTGIYSVEGMFLLEVLPSVEEATAAHQPISNEVPVQVEAREMAHR